MTPQTAYPLYWPATRPRCTNRRANTSFKQSFAGARDECLREVSLLKGSGTIISTNIPLKRDGQPQHMEWGKTIPDPGVAVYFTRDQRELCFACDCWRHVQDNMHAINLTIAALRGIARWGTGDMMEAAFAGFKTLPAPGGGTGVKWWEVLGVPLNSPPDAIKAAYKILAVRHHPDRGGARELWDRLQTAYHLALGARE